MFLKKFIYVNWGNIPAMEFEFGPINLISGGNGSGKTTAADALQTIMTAAHDNLFNYNPGQDEASQRGRNKNVRTLASYVLGCDDGSYARPEGAIGYLAAVFHPTQGEDGDPFTAVIGVSASVDRASGQPVARQNDLQFYIVTESLALNDFVQENLEGQRQVLALNKLPAHLKQRFENSAVEKYDTKKQYLRRLYGALRGRVDAVSEREALHAARTFSRFMAYKPVKSINSFVANEVLEEKDLGDAIRSVSDLMKTIYGLEAQANTLAATIATLNQARTGAQSYIQQWLNYQLLAFSTAQSRFNAEQKAYTSAKDKQLKLRDALKVKEQERALAQDKRKQVREQLLSLEAKRQGVAALQSKDQAETILAQGKQQLHELSLPLLEQDQLLQASLRATELVQQAMQKTAISAEVDSLASKSLQLLAKQVLAIREQDALDLRKLLGKDWIDLSPLEQHLSTAQQQEQLLNQWRERFFIADEQTGVSIRDQVAKVLDRREQKLQQWQSRLQQKQSDIHSLEASQLNYPHYVRQAIEAISRACPQAEPRVLADYVEVKDSRWQNAIEGYIGGARFSIIVDEEYEAQAAQAVRNMAGGSRARVVQGSKAKQDAERARIPANSIVHLMDFEHATARAYVAASFGQVEQAESTEALRHIRRGVTQEGLGSGGYSIYRCDIDETDLAFGQGARERALVAKQQELEQLYQQSNELQQQVKEAQNLLDAIQLLRPASFAKQMQAMLNVHYDMQKAEATLSQVDVSDFAELEQEFSVLKQQADSTDQEITRLDSELGALQQQLEDISEQCKKLSAASEAASELAEEQEEQLRALPSIWPSFELAERLKQAKQDAANNSVESLEAEYKQLTQSLGSLSLELERSIAEHNLNCNTIDAIVYTPDYREQNSTEFFQKICGLEQEVGRVYNRLKNNILVEKQSQLAQLRESFNNVFVTNLCHSIYQAINDGKRILEDLNKELAFHKFGADQETYWFDWQWVPEFKEYWQFFEEIIKNPSLGEGATLFDAELSKSSQQVRDRLMSMLLDDDEQKAMRELERISDYRNYRSYEIYKQPANKEPIALSQYGTGSGGQLETPAYIIRSAAVSSAFRFNEGDTHLRMVLVDEAFSKMDETRSKEVINYLTESLGLQLLFIMPTSKSGPFMDMISNQFVFAKVPLAGGQKIGELQTRVLVDRQQCNQDKVKELWANHRKAIRHQAALDFMEEFIN